MVAASLCVAGPIAAAELGDECCGDLQERVAELETASASNSERPVSLTVSGEIARAMLIWDDGIGADTSIIDGAAQSASSAPGTPGQARVSQRWMTGFIIELGFTDTSSAFAGQVNEQGPGETAFELRLANWYIESEQLGRLTVDEQGSANGGITTIDLTRAKTDPVFWHNRPFGVSDQDGGYGGLIWGNVAWGLDDFIHYDSPVLHGFTASVASGNIDGIDAARRFQNELDEVRIAAGAGYLWVGDESAVSLYPSETKIASGSISMVDVPTGLFGNGAAGVGVDGVTTRDNDILRGYAGFSGNGMLPASVTVGEIAGTEVSHQDAGAMQETDAASVEMYAVFCHFDAQIRVAQGGTEPWYGVVLGSRQNF